MSARIASASQLLGTEAELGGRKREAMGAAFRPSPPTTAGRYVQFPTLVAGINGLLTNTKRSLSFQIGGSMSTLVFRCPITLQAIDSGIETDSSSLARVQLVSVRIRCPHCSKKHEQRTKDGHLAEAA